MTELGNTGNENMISMSDKIRHKFCHQWVYMSQKSLANSAHILQDADGKEEKGQEAIYLEKQQYSELSLRIRPYGS